MENHDAETWVYHYDRAEKFFLGKSLAQKDPLGDGVLVPGNATLVAPPEKWPDGFVPIFDGEDWEILNDNFWRPQSREVNYDAGRSMSTWHPKAISLGDFPRYPDLDRLANSLLVVTRLVDNIRYVDAKFQQLVDLHSKFQNGVSGAIDDANGGASLQATPTLFGTYKFECEALVLQMRHCLDTLCRLTELLINANRVNDEKVFRCDSVGAVLGSQKNSLVANVVRGLGSNYLTDKTNFLEVSNNLFNAMKHTHMNAETQSIFGADTPTIVAYLGPTKEDKNTVIFHNHNAYHFVMGFHDTVDRILRNQRAYVASQ